MKLKELRQKSGLSQKELADKLGVDQSAISNWESGKNGATLKMLIKVAEILHVSVDELVGSDDTTVSSNMNQTVHPQEDSCHYENFVKLCNSVGKTPSAVAIELGLSKAAITRWKNGGGATDATKHKIADYFAVDINTITEEPKREPPQSASAQENEREEKILQLFRKLSPEAQEIFFVQLEAVAAAQEKERLFKK